MQVLNVLDAIAIALLCLFPLLCKMFADADGMLLLAVSMSAFMAVSWQLRRVNGIKFAKTDVALGALVCFCAMDMPRAFDCFLLLQLLSVMAVWTFMRQAGQSDKRWLVVGLTVVAVAQVGGAIAQVFELVSSNHAYLSITGAFGNSGPLAVSWPSCWRTFGLILLAWKERTADGH